MSTLEQLCSIASTSILAFFLLGPVALAANDSSSPSPSSPAGGEKVRWAYQLIDSTGTEVEGTIEAETKEAAEALLREKGFVTRIARIPQPRIAASARSTSVTPECFQFLDELRALLEAGQPLRPALNNLAHSEPPRPWAKQLVDEYGRGGSLSNAMEQSSGLFPFETITIVGVGESGGRLPAVLHRY